MNRFLLNSILPFATLCVINVHAQTKNADSIKAITPAFDVDTLLAPTPVNLAVFVDKVRDQIKKSDLKDGEIDHVIELEDQGISQKLTSALLVQAPKILIRIQNMDGSHQQKIQYLRALENRMRYWNFLPTTAENAGYIKSAVANFENILRAISQNTISSFINENETITTLDNSELLTDKPDLVKQLYVSLGKSQPEKIIQRLSAFYKEPYADAIVATAAKVDPATVMKYALSTGNLSGAIRRNNDSYVKTIVKMVDNSPHPQKILPFIDAIYSGSKTVQQINALSDNPTEYYKALVQLKLQGGSAKFIDDEIYYRGLQFVRIANQLHESSNATRFRCMADFDAEDLYFMMIGSQDEIYTSSFIWMFERMMDKMKPLDGEAFLEKVHKTKFRTFIRMAAGYNELSTFLASMREDQKNALMKEFVSGLEQGPLDDLEDAVDVADAFGSLTDPKLIEFLKEEIKAQYNRKVNEKGMAIYSLLYTIFNNSDKSSELNNELGNNLPPITYLPVTSLEDKDGKIVQQVFIYGDKDGMGTYNGYLSLYQNNKWKIEKNKYWATVTSTGKVPIVVYINVPLPEEADENDIFAQRKLQDYIDENGLKPTIIVHRGHSYYLNSTLDHLTSSAKIVILGSCGGYHNLAKVLDASPDANIISSKQVGAYRVNVPIIRSLNDILLTGKDVDWIEMWRNLSKYFASQGAETQDLFSDYVPPYKNLGAIFIKAYRKQVALERK
jgi:hypothetical protein